MPSRSIRSSSIARADDRESATATPVTASAQNQEVEPVASGCRARSVLASSYGSAETFFTAEELVLAEIAQRRVGLAESVHLAEEVREAGRVRLTNLLMSLLPESCGRERTAGLLHGRKGVDCPSGLGEPADVLDPVVSVRRALAAHAAPDEDGSAGA